MRLLVAIPTRSNWQGLNKLGDLLWADGYGENTIIFDHGHHTAKGRETLGKFLNVVRSEGWPFYRMWNEAWRTAHEEGYDAVALLNDDITLAPGGLTEASRIFETDDKIGVVGLNWQRQVYDGLVLNFPVVDVKGAHRRGGIPGWAFLLRANLWGQMPPIDEAYHIWYGDDELFALTAKAGFRTVIATGVPVDHETSVTLQKHPELSAKSGEDHQRFVRRWGHQ